MPAYEAPGQSDDWHTPRYIFDALGEHFDLDVAAPPEGPRHVPCDRWISENSLDAVWQGFVWMNPPFGHQRTKMAWLCKFFDHGNGIALVPDRTSAPWFQEFAPVADAILWVAPKIKFERPDGSLGESPGTGTALLAAGDRAARALSRARSLGFVTVNAKPGYWTEVKEGRWRDGNGNIILRETVYPRSFDALVVNGSKTTYALKTPDQLWCDVESYPTFEDAAASAERTGTERDSVFGRVIPPGGEPQAPEK